MGNFTLGRYLPLDHGNAAVADYNLFPCRMDWLWRDICMCICCYHIIKAFCFFYLESYEANVIYAILPSCH